MHSGSRGIQTIAVLPRVLLRNADEASYLPNPLTVAWRSILLPAKCFTSTVSFGWHHLREAR
jgi:hypothetical protein